METVNVSKRQQSKQRAEKIKPHFNCKTITTWIFIN